MDDIKLVHEFEKNALETVRAFISTYKRKEYLNLRTFYRHEDGSMRPTPKGLTLSVDLITELIAAVEALRAAVDDADKRSGGRRTE
jgi:hypothetical protein